MVRSLKLVDPVEAEDEGSSGAYVTLHPAMAQIPEMQYALCDDAQVVYWKWAGRLQQRGLLNEETLGWVISLASYTDEIVNCRAKKNSIRYAQMGIDSQLKKLNRLYGDQSVSAGSAANPYSRFGFARRARQQRHGQH